MPDFTPSAAHVVLLCLGCDNSYTILPGCTQLHSRPSTRGKLDSPTAGQFCWFVNQIRSEGEQHTTVHSQHSDGSSLSDTREREHQLCGHCGACRMETIVRSLLLCDYTACAGHLLCLACFSAGTLPMHAHLQNAEIFTMTYGSIVRQLITDLDDIELVNKQLDAMYGCVCTPAARSTVPVLTLCARYPCVTTCA